jgi:hypothetical protein
VLLAATLHLKLGGGKVAFLAVRDFGSSYLNTLEMQPFLDAKLWIDIQ